jgi:hypothetical protein
VLPIFIGTGSTMWQEEQMLAAKINFLTFRFKHCEIPILTQNTSKTPTLVQAVLHFMQKQFLF